MWAKKTDKTGIESLIDYYREKRRNSKTYIIGFVIFWLIGLFAVSKDVEYFIFGVIAFGFLWGSLIGLSLWQIKSLKNFDIGGYALSNRRIFELDENLNIAKHFDARRVKHVFEGAGGIVLKPVQRTWLKNRKLYLIEGDVYTTINQIDAAIKQRVN